MKRLGAILAGGKSVRFGSDKAAALLRGKPLLDHVVAGLRPVCDEIVIVGRESPGLISLPDKPSADMGPLGGLCAALYYAEKQGFDTVITAGCDMMPVIWPKLNEAPLEAAVVVDNHYLAGIWPAALSGRLQRYLQDTDNLSMRGWIEHCGGQLETPTSRVFNINDPQDLGDYEKLLAES